MNKISTACHFPRAAVESEATRQDVEAAVNGGMKTQVSIDDRQLFECEVIDSNIGEASSEEINESADRPRTRKSLRVRMGRRDQLQAGPSTGSRETTSRDGVLSDDASLQEGTRPKVQRREQDKQDRANPKQVPQLAGRKKKKSSRGTLIQILSRQLLAQKCWGTASAEPQPENQENSKSGTSW